MMQKLAIIGAGGFVGTRLVESLVLEPVMDFTAVVRSPKSLARLCRFGSRLDCRFADATRADQLSRALADHAVVVNLVSGAGDNIWQSTQAIYQACLNAGVKRLIHLSSAVVFGIVDSPAIGDESEPLPMNRLWSPYAKAKARSEIFFRDHRNETPFEITILRPGIVWGPKSPWSHGAARDLCDGAAYLIGRGEGICNALYVDNLVRYILTCATAQQSATGCFNISDKEEITWRDFYASLASACGYTMTHMPIIEGDRFRPGFKGRVEAFKSSAPYTFLKEKIDPETRGRVKSWLASLLSGKDGGRVPEACRQPRAPEVTREMWELQSVRRKLDNAGFRARFDLPPLVSFAEGTRRTIHWLRYIGLIS